MLKRINGVDIVEMSLNFYNDEFELFDGIHRLKFVIKREESNDILKELRFMEFLNFSIISCKDLRAFVLAMNYLIEYRKGVLKC